MNRTIINGKMVDIWQNDTTVYMAFTTNTDIVPSFPEMYQWANNKDDISITIDRKPPIKIVDLAYESNVKEAD